MQKKRRTDTSNSEADVNLNATAASSSSSNSSRATDSHQDASISSEVHSYNRELKAIIKSVSDADYDITNWQEIYTKAKKLLQYADTNIKAGSKKDTIMHIAVMSGISDFATSVYKANKSLLSVENSVGQTPLLLAAEQATGGNAGWIIRQLVHRSPLTVVNKKNPAGDAAIHFVIRRCMPQAVEMFLEVGADFSQTDKNGKSCSDLAQNAPNASGNKDKLLSIIKRSKNQKNSTETTESAASSSSSSSSASFTAHTSAAISSSSQSALHIESINKKIAALIQQATGLYGTKNAEQKFNGLFKELYQLLLQTGDLTIRNSLESGINIVHVVARLGTIEQAQMLHRINPQSFAQAATAIDSDKQTPLYYAIHEVENPNALMVNFLLTNGSQAVINFQEELGSATPLHAAVYRMINADSKLANTMLDIIKLLIKHGAQTNIVDADELTPIQWAKKKAITSDESVLAILQSSAQPIVTPFPSSIASASSSSSSSSSSSIIKSEPAQSPINLPGKASAPASPDKNSANASPAASDMNASPEPIQQVTPKKRGPKPGSKRATPTASSGPTAQLTYFIEKQVAESGKNFDHDFKTIAVPLLHSADILIKNKNGVVKTTLLHLVTGYGSLDQAETILALSERKFVTAAKAQNSDGQTPLFGAVSFAKFSSKLVELLLKNGGLAVINIKENTVGQTPLHAAVVRCEKEPEFIEIVRLLIKYGARTDLNDTYKTTPADRARKDITDPKTRAALLEILDSKNNRDSDSDNESSTILRKPKRIVVSSQSALATEAINAPAEAQLGIAQLPEPVSSSAAQSAENNPTEALRILLEKCISNKYEWTQSEVSQVVELIKTGADLTQKVGKLQETILHIAAKADRLRVVSAVLKKNKSVLRILNGFKRTPLQVAIEYTQKSFGPISTALLDKETINNCDVDNETAINAAVERRSIVMIEKLINLDVDLSVGKNWESTLNIPKKNRILEIHTEAIRNILRAYEKKTQKMTNKSSSSSSSLNNSITEKYVAMPTASVKSTETTISKSGKFEVVEDEQENNNAALSTKSATSSAAVLQSSTQLSSEKPAELSNSEALVLQEVANTLLVTLIDEAQISNAQNRREALQVDILPLAPNLLTTGKNNKSILHILAHDGDLETARELQQNNPEVFAKLINAKDGNNQTPLDIAFRENKTEFLQLLVGIKTDSKIQQQDLLIALATRANEPTWEAILNNLYTSGRIDTQNKENQKTLYETLIKSMGKEKALKLLTGWLKNKLGK